MRLSKYKNESSSWYFISHLNPIFEVSSRLKKRKMKIFAVSSIAVIISTAFAAAQTSAYTASIVTCTAWNASAVTPDITTSTATTPLSH